MLRFAESGTDFIVLLVRWYCCKWRWWCVLMVVLMLFCADCGTDVLCADDGTDVLCAKGGTDGVVC